MAGRCGKSKSRDRINGFCSIVSVRQARVSGVLPVDERPKQVGRSKWCWLTNVGFLHSIVSGFCRGLERARNMGRRTTLRERIETRIARRRGEDVFLPREFADLG